MVERHKGAGVLLAEAIGQGVTGEPGWPRPSPGSWGTRKAPPGGIGRRDKGRYRMPARGLAFPALGTTAVRCVLGFWGPEREAPARGPLPRQHCLRAEGGCLEGPR